MANAMFCYPNWVDHSDTVLSGGSWETALPLSNLQDQRLARVARSTDDATASAIVNLDFSNQKYIYVFAIPSSNLTIDALVKVSLSNNSDMSSPTYSTGWVKAYPVIYPSDMPLWDDPGTWDGYLAQDEYDLGETYGWTHVLTAPTNGRYCRVEIDDTANPDTYIDLGRLVIASGYQPIINFEVGAGLGWQTASTVSETDGGASYHNDRPRKRIFNCVLIYQSDDEAMVHMWTIQRMLGTSTQIFFVFDISDTVHLPRRSFLAT
ncbi:MAG TPA: hypothetical protein VM118_05630, partial [Acidobacteriota bacterium]|nr:hypothetical protein [Acidobacteriota bacterium]